MAPVIVGVGNPQRGDDKAGREAARRLKEKGLRARIVETEGEATALLSLLEGAESVYLIDACVSGAPAGTVRRIDVAKDDLGEVQCGVSSHGFGLAEAIALAKTLGALPPKCTIFAIEGESFAMGAPLSPLVRQSIDKVVDALCREIESL